MKKILILLVIILIAWSPSLLADSVDTPKEKSMAVAWTLSLLPFNAPAFFYAGQPVKGAITTPLQLAGAGLSIYGLVSFINGFTTTVADGTVAGIAGTTTDNHFSTLGTVSLASGAVLYWGTWIYSVVKAPHDTREYNDYIRAKKISVAPDIKFDNTSVYAGISVTF